MSNKFFKDNNSNAEKLRLKQRMQIRIRKSLLKKRNPFIAFVVAVILFVSMIITSKITTNTAVKTINSADYPNHSTQISFVGDVMLGRYIEDYGDKISYEHFFNGISDIWQNSDYVIANLECALILRDESEYSLPDKNIHISTNANAISAMQDAGINAISYANNHCLDFGSTAYQEAIEYFENIGLACTGSVLHRDERDDVVADTKLITSSGKSIGFIGVNDAYFTDIGNGGGMLTSHNISLYQYVNNSAINNDLTIVYVHWGGEYVTNVDDEQVELAHQLIDAGADIVLGSHPHVLQPIEKYGQGIIFYSLGNFIMDQNNSFTRDSVVIQYNERVDGSSFFEIIPVRITDGCPTVTDNAFYKSRIKTVLTKKLSTSDYSVDTDGHIIIEF